MVVGRTYLIIYAISLFLIFLFFAIGIYGVRKYKTWLTILSVTLIACASMCPMIVLLAFY